MSAPAPICSQCGSALAAHRLGGLCPRCVARAFNSPPSVECGASKQKADSAQDEPSAERRPPELGKSEFLVEQELARGGMGVVFEAQDASIGRRVVVKFLRPDRDTTAAAVDRFLAEARITGQLEHPAIVPVYHLGVTADGRPFYAMKLIQGEKLTTILERLKRGEADTISRYRLAALLNVFQKICDAVAYAHSRGVVHRDLKPDNVMIGAFGEVIVMDWGLAKTLSNSKGHENLPAGSSRGNEALAGKPETRSPKSEIEVSLLTSAATSDSPAEAKEEVHWTLDNTILGTPGFMAPEQAEGHSKEADERTDVYSLGAILYTILTLQPPVRGRDAPSILKRTKTGNIRSPTDYNPGASDVAASVPLLHCPNRRIPAALSAVAMKALAVRPEDRYQRVLDLQKDVTAYQNGLPTFAEQAGWWVRAGYWIKRHRTATAVVLLVALLVAGFSWRNWRTLVELRNTAPSLIALAESLVTAQKFPEALERVEVALRLQPDRADYLVLKGNILLALLRAAEARDSLARALSINPSLTPARHSLALSERLLTVRGNKTELTTEALIELYQALVEQGRSAEAYAVSKHIDAAENRFVALLQERLTRGGITNQLYWTEHRPAGLRETTNRSTNRTTLRDTTFLALKFVESNIADLAPLKGIPLQELTLSDCTSVADLRPLQGMPLTHLSFTWNTVSDLSPLSDMPLEVLYFAFNRVSDLGPLSTISTLRSLNFHNVDVGDLGPLKGLRLETLLFGSIRATSLEPLRGMPLTTLSFHYVKIADLSPLSDLPLQDLRIRNTNVSDLSPLQGLPLRVLHLINCPLITDLSPLKDCQTLEQLALPPNARNIEFLQTFPNLKGISYTEQPLAAAVFWKAHHVRKHSLK